MEEQKKKHRLRKAVEQSATTNASVTIFDKASHDFRASRPVSFELCIFFFSALGSVDNLTKQITVLKNLQCEHFEAWLKQKKT